MYKLEVAEILLWRFSNEEDSLIQINIHLRKISLLIITRGNIYAKSPLFKKPQPTNQKNPQCISVSVWRGGDGEKVIKFSAWNFLSVEK